LTPVNSSRRGFEENLSGVIPYITIIRKAVTVSEDVVQTRMEE